MIPPHETTTVITFDLETVTCSCMNLLPCIPENRLAPTIVRGAKPLALPSSVRLGALLFAKFGAGKVGRRSSPIIRSWPRSGRVSGLVGRIVGGIVGGIVS